MQTLPRGLLALFLCSLAQDGARAQNSQPNFEDSDISIRNILAQLEKYKRVASLVNGASTSWQASTAALSSWSVDRLLSLANLRVVANDYNKLPSQNYNVPNENQLLEYPTNFAADEKWPQCAQLIRDIQDQSYCGSCWAVATAATLSDRICISSKGALRIKLSAQDLLECCKDCGYGCNGGTVANSYLYWLNQGIVTGGAFLTLNNCKPYKFAPCSDKLWKSLPQCTTRNSAVTCAKTCAANYKKPYEEDKVKGKAVYKIVGGERALIHELVSHGSVTVSLTVYQDFLTYKAGIYSYTTGELLGNHAVKLIGYGVEKETKYWLCVNSWGDDWGDRGTFKILRGVNHMQIETHPVAGTPAL